MLKRYEDLLLRFLALVSFLSMGSVRAQSIAPAADGTGTLVQQIGNTYRIEGGTQAGANLFHSFQQLGLQPNEIADFLSQAEIENVLGRVTGGSPSLIEGLLRVSGSDANLYLMNPAGIVFGQDASLDLRGSFTATTADAIGVGEHFFNVTGLNDYQALAGQPNSFIFSSATPGSIINAANLTVSGGETLGLLGGTIINTGDLAAPGGQITIAAVPGETLVRINQQGMVLGLDVAPSSFLNGADAAVLQVIDLPTLLTDPAIQHATGVRVNENGELHLSGARLLLSDAMGTTLISGKLDVADSLTSPTPHTPHPTPQIDILGDRVALLDAQLNASGIGGGGLVRVGGDYQGQGMLPTASRVFVGQDSTIKVDAIDWGDGGRAIVWADEATAFYGSVSARGGAMAGDGGFVEISGYQDLRFRGRVDAGAANGTNGRLLLDPTDIVVTAAGAAGGFSGTPSGGLGQVLFSDTGPTTITQNQLQDGTLANVDILLQATNSITINPLSGGVLNFASGSGSITFQARGDFSMNTSDTIRTNGRSLAISGANLTTGNIDTSETEVGNAAGGDVMLSGTNITTGNITTSAISTNNGDALAGDVTLNASGAIATQAVNTSATRANAVTAILNATGGAVSLTAGDAISTGTITTAAANTINEGGAIATGGAVTFNMSSTLNVGAIDTSATANNFVTGDATALGGAVTLNSNGAISANTFNVSASADANVDGSGVATSGAVVLNSGSTAGSNIQYFWQYRHRQQCLSSGHWHGTGYGHGYHDRHRWHD